MKTLLNAVGAKNLVELGVISSNVKLPYHLIDKRWATLNAKFCIFYPDSSNSSNLKLLPKYLIDDYPEPKWLEIIQMLSGIFSYKEIYIRYTKDTKQLPLFMYLYYRDVIVPNLVAVSKKRRSEFIKYSALYSKKTNNSEKIPSPDEPIAIEAMTHNIAECSLSVYNKPVQDISYTEGFKLELMITYKRLTGQI